MTRESRVPGEKPLFWVGSAKSDLVRFPEVVKDHIGVALSVAQFGGKHPSAKPWKGKGPGVFEIVSGGSTSISTGVGSVKMSSTNAANNASWIPIKYDGTIYYIPAWTTNSP